MGYRLVLLLLVPLLVAAAPLPLVTEPDTPTLGNPFRVSIDLPEPESHLAALPDITPFILLAPPATERNRIILYLLPLRPGEAEIPPLPVLQGRATRLTTSALTFNIEPGPAPAELNPLRPLPEETLPAGRHLLYTILAVATLVPVIGLVLLRAYRKMDTAPPEMEHPLLVDLVQRLRESGPCPSPEWLEFRRRLERLRFAPLPQAEEEILALRQEFLRLRKEGR